MKIKLKPSIYMIVLFVLTTIATIGGLYKYLTWMLATENSVMFKLLYKRAAKVELSDSQYLMIIAIVVLLMLMKSFGSFFMFRSKTWGYALYILPNLILAGIMGLIMSVIAIGDWTTPMLLIGGGTLAFIVAYTIALVLIIKRRKASRE